MKLLLTLIIYGLCCNLAFAQKSAESHAMPAGAEFTLPSTEALSMPQVRKRISAKIRYDLVEENQKGIKIYPKIQVDNLANAEVLLTASFYLPQAFTPQYTAQLMLTADTKGELYFFIPYSRLNLAAKKVHKLKFDIVAYANGKPLQSSVFYHSIINML